MAGEFYATGSSIACNNPEHHNHVGQTPFISISGGDSYVVRVGGTWTFYINIYIESRWNIEVIWDDSRPSSWDISVSQQDGVVIGSTSGPIRGKVWQTGTVKKYVGQAVIPGIRGKGERLNVNIHANLRGTNGNNGIYWNSKGCYINDLWQTGYFDVSEIQLNPTLTGFWWRTSEIYENALIMEFTADQGISGCRVQVTNLDTGERSGEIDPGCADVNGNTHKWFGVRDYHWSGIQYAHHYRVHLRICNTDGLWNAADFSTEPDYSLADANTGNHKPVLKTLEMSYDMDSYSANWAMDIPTDIAPDYPKSSMGDLEYNHPTEDVIKGHIRYGNIRPGANVIFRLQVLSSRRFESDASHNYGSYTSDLIEEFLKLRQPAKIEEFPNFIFGNPLAYLINNDSECNGIVQLYCNEVMFAQRPFKKDLEYAYGYQVASLTQEEWDTLYRQFRKPSEVTILVKVTTVGKYEDIDTFYHTKCILTGNVKTNWIGINGVPKRTKDFIAPTAERVPMRAVAWIGANGEARRCT